MRWAYPTNNSHWRDAELPDWIPEVADASSGWLVGYPSLIGKVRFARHPPEIGEQVPIELPRRRNAAKPSRPPLWLTLKMGRSESRSPPCRLGIEEDFEGFENTCYSQRNTFAESAVHTINATASAVRSRVCAHHASPFQIPSSSDTA